MAANPPLDITASPASFQATYAQLAEVHFNRDPAHTAADARERVVAEWGDWQDGALFAFQALLFDYPGTSELFLRDGSVAMTGDLDLDSNSITNGVNLNGRAIAQFVIAPLSLTASTLAFFPNSDGQTLSNTSFTVADVTVRAGTTAFTGTITGIDPTVDAHLTTRKWVADRGGWVNTGSSTAPSVAGRQSSYTSTNNATITDFTGAVDGQIITYFVDSATKVFTHGSSTIRLKNEISAQLRQYDSLTLGYNGSHWREISRTRAKFITALGGLTTPDSFGVEIGSISGATTIADFLNPYDGQELRLFATSSFQVQHTSGLIELSGSANFNMVAGDTLTLLHDGTAWQEMGRKVA